MGEDVANEIKDMIDKYTGDTSVSLEECLERAEDIAAHVDSIVLALREDIGD